jgi:hypothetical protein
MNDPKERAEKCNQEIQASLKKYDCKLIGNPIFSVISGNMKVATEVKVLPITRVNKPKETNEEPTYIN